MHRARISKDGRQRAEKTPRFGGCTAASLTQRRWHFAGACTASVDAATCQLPRETVVGERLASIAPRPSI